MTASNALNDSASGVYKVNSLVIHADADPLAGDRYGMAECWLRR
jgi:hypothetical protein